MQRIRFLGETERGRERESERKSVSKMQRASVFSVRSLAYSRVFVRHSDRVTDRQIDRDQTVTDSYSNSLRRKQTEAGCSGIKSSG